MTVYSAPLDDMRFVLNELLEVEKLAELPGFEDVQVTFDPVKLMEQIARRPDVKTDRYYENDAGDVTDGIVSAQQG